MFFLQESKLKSTKFHPYLFTFFNSVPIILQIYLFAICLSDGDQPVPVEPPPKVTRVFPLDHEFLEIGLIDSKFEQNYTLSGSEVYGYNHYYQVKLEANSFECYYIKLKAGLDFYIHFQVLKGADRNIDVDVIQPNGYTLITFEWTDQGTNESPLTMDGIYTICLDNRLSRFSTKVVNFYILAYGKFEWQNHVQELVGYQTGLDNFTQTFTNISENIKKMANVQYIDGKQLIMDWYLIRDNNWYVQWLSIFMCTLIVTASGMQVFFVRKLFTVPKTTASAKPRA